MGSGYSKMKKQARLFGQQMEQMRQEAARQEVTGTSGNGLVTVTINGEREVKSLTIKPECVDLQDIEGLQDLICAACQNAYSKLGDTPALGFELPFGL
jgi:DNA-binding YbaB/EbfC family protein